MPLKLLVIIMLNKINEELLKYSIKLKRKELERLEIYYTLYTKEVKKSDLSRIYDFKNIIKKHFVDSLLLNKYYKFNASDIVMDIGSGAGFPGIMLAITNIETHFILAEPRPKRVKFLNTTINDLNLFNTEVLAKKITKNIKLQIKPNIVVTRALEDMSFTLERVKDFMGADGQVIFMKGPNYTSDIERAKQLSYIFKLEKVFKYSLTEKDKRVLISYRKLDF